MLSKTFWRHDAEDGCSTITTIPPGGWKVKSDLLLAGPDGLHAVATDCVVHRHSNANIYVNKHDDEPRCRHASFNCAKEYFATATRNMTCLMYPPKPTFYHIEPVPLYTCLPEHKCINSEKRRSL